MREKISERCEDYLKTILNLENTYDVVRARDVAKSMGVHRSSVALIIRQLKNKEMVDHEPYSTITLTSEGRKIASRLFEYHSVILDFFLNVLEMDRKIAELAACRMEHIVDPQTLKKIEYFL